MSKLLLIIVPLILIVGFFVYKPIQPDSVPVQVTPTPASNPYSINSLNKKLYDSEIKIENEIRKTAKFISYRVSFVSDGLNQYALMNVPLGKKPDSGWAVIIVNHGYIEPSVYSTENSYINTSAYYANAGFLVVKPDYRGHDQSQGETGSIVSRIGYAIDVLNLLFGIKKLTYADPQKIYMYGHSMGGDVSLRVAEICLDCIKAVSLWAPAVTDWPESYMYFVRKDQIDPKRKERFEKMQIELKTLFIESDYSQISTMTNVNLLQIPIIFHHGTLDESVPYEWGVRLSEKLKQSNIEHTFHTYQNDNHDIASNWSTALNRDIEFFNK